VFDLELSSCLLLLLVLVLLVVVVVGRIVAGLEVIQWQSAPLTNYRAAYLRFRFA